MGRSLYFFEINNKDINASNLAGNLASIGRVQNTPLTVSKRMECRQLIKFTKLTDDIRSKLILGLKLVKIV